MFNSGGGESDPTVRHDEQYPHTGVVFSQGHVSNINKLLGDSTLQNEHTLKDILSLADNVEAISSLADVFERQLRQFDITGRLVMIRLLQQRKGVDPDVIKDKVVELNDDVTTQYGELSNLLIAAKAFIDKVAKEHPKKNQDSFVVDVKELMALRQNEISEAKNYILSLRQ